MATKFKRITEALLAHKATLADLPSSDTVHDKQTLDKVQTDISSNIRNQVGRYVERAEEIVEEKQLYGPKMVAKVRPASGKIFYTTPNLHFCADSRNGRNFQGS
jgi:ribosomal protein S17E